jgi:hypothetical protein
MDRLGRFRLLEKLESGRSGEQYLAWDPARDQQVVVRVLHPFISINREAEQWFFKVAASRAQWDHRRIVRIWEIGSYWDHFYLAMRYIQGPSLKARMRKAGVLGWKEALQIVNEVGEALSYLHREGQVHQDVKPGNILLGPDGAVLTDYGLVLAQAGKQPWQAGVVGTPGYMAPEVLQGQPASPASDQFSLACVLVKMLRGKSPRALLMLDADTQRYHHVMALSGAWPAEAPDNLAAVLRRAMDAQPWNRYEKISDLLSELAGKRVPAAPGRVLAGDPVHSVLPGPFEWCDIPACEGYEMIDENGILVGTWDLDAFRMAKYPVTNAQFEVFVRAEDGYGNDRWWEGLGERQASPLEPWSSDEDLPREEVTWYEAMAFCRWLSHRVGYVVRLPTEWEWQWAAEGPERWDYPWGNEFDLARCNSRESGIGELTRVYWYPEGASVFGVLDLSGNVWEWCLNEPPLPYREITGGEEVRVRRGGCNADLPENLRTSSYEWDYLDDALPGRGFRCVREP